MVRLARFVAVAALMSAVASAARAEDGHGPAAPRSQFPSHAFQRAPRAPDAQLSFHYGLLQPLLLAGFNAAVDLRIGRFVASYSHGHGLDAGRAPGVLSPAEKRLNARLLEPYSTGLGLGVTLVDELYALVDLKLHAFELDLDGERARYKTLTLGVEVGYRFFVWKGLHITPVLRYWPNVWDSTKSGRLRVTTRDGAELVHEPVGQGLNGSGLFANLLVGWAFDVE